MLPIYAAFALQFVPRVHEGDPTGGQGWPILVCDQVDEVGDIATLLLNASIIVAAVYILVIASAVIRLKFLGQAPDGTPVKRPKKKR